MYLFYKLSGALSLLICVSFSVSAQTGVAVNTTGAAPATGTILDVTSADNTSSSFGLRVNTDRFTVRGDGMVGVGQLPENNIQLAVRSINLGSTIGDLSIAQQWNTNVGNSQYLRLFSRKSLATGGWSGSDLYLQRYVDADGNAMGFIKWAAGDWGIELGSGTNTYFKVRNSGGAIVRGNGGILDIEATDHGYIQWYPEGIAAGRKAYTGFPGAGSIDFSVANQNPNGRIDLVTAAGGSVRANSLAGTGTRVVTADASGNLSATYGGWVKIHETTLTGISTTIDISGLDLDAHKVYEVYFTGSSTNGGEVMLYFNGDYTNLNYRSQHGHFYNGSTGIALRSYPEIGTFNGSGALFISIKIMRGPDGLPRFLAHETEMTSTAHGEHLYGGKRNTAENVTSLRISKPSGAGFGIGTRVIIMGLL